MKRLSPKRKLEVLVIYHDTGRGVRETERLARCSHHTLADILLWFHKLTEEEVFNLASYCGLPVTPLVTLYQSAPKLKGDLDEVYRGHIKILYPEVEYWKGENANIVRKFVTLQIGMVGDHGLLQPAVLSFPGQSRPDVILHYADRAPYSQINQASVSLHDGERVRVDIVCSEPFVDARLARLAKTSGEVYCSEFCQPSDEAREPGCFIAHPVALAYPAQAYLEPFYLKPGNYGVKITLPYEDGSASAYLRICSPAKADALYGELIYVG